MKRRIEYYQEIVHRSEVHPLWRLWLDYRADSVPTQKDFQIWDFKQREYKRKVAEIEEQDAKLRLQEMVAGESNLSPSWATESHYDEQAQSVPSLDYVSSLPENSPSIQHPSETASGGYDYSWMLKTSEEEEDYSNIHSEKLQPWTPGNSYEPGNDAPPEK
eukprot:TRINITY_DN4695_c0_g1_i1.p1 TRINITY_DN4695_c0_g1~~TRINITY_DN4695_c0_g1_i1.p1  ORF type:complete len:161 (+),score=36.14 TRINITY_DN4695_c0_g1_i1:184-666(+)